jgi:hypothetical protein
MRGSNSKPGSQDADELTPWRRRLGPRIRCPRWQMLSADRDYWDIENGLHPRPDVTAGEDRSRARHLQTVLVAPM